MSNTIGQDDKLPILNVKIQNTPPQIYEVHTPAHTVDK